MITIEQTNGELVKVFRHLDTMDIGIHKLFGFISSEHAEHRIEKRKLMFGMKRIIL